MKIVVIEDNEDILDIISFILTDDGHEVLSCPNGSIVKNFAAIQPDLILLDEILPAARGSEICKQLKSNLAYKHIPVVLVSTIPRLSTVAANCGADDFLEKPFNIEHFQHMVKKFNLKVNRL